ncbi:MAG: hypothetical protein Q4P66_09000 [Actinomycetaceae bacterium]|nr:hypothetical protein [Actinomycetaceae bacterium]
MANQYDNQQFNPQSSGTGHTPHPQGNQPIQSSQYSQQSMPGVTPQSSSAGQPEPQFGAMATPDQPGQLNGQDYYPGSVAQQQPYSGSDSHKDDTYYQDHLRRQGGASSSDFGHHGRSITDGIAGMGQPGVPGQPPIQTEPQPLPSRTWPIVLTVGGFVTSLVIAPIVFFVMTVYSFSGLIDVNNPEEVAVGKSIELGKPIDVTQEGESLLLIAPNAEWQCDAINEDNGSKVHFAPENKTSSDPHEVLWSGSAELSKGTYTFECTNPDNVEATTVSYIDAETVIGAGLGILGAFGIGTLLGIGGLIIGIVGVVWLVRRNKERRKIQLSNAFGAPLY